MSLPRSSAAMPRTPSTKTSSAWLAGLGSSSCAKSGLWPSPSVGSARPSPSGAAWPCRGTWRRLRS
eukprot:3154385-Lingulodinium_polyedra.AAC.1